MVMTASRERGRAPHDDDCCKPPVPPNAKGPDNILARSLQLRCIMAAESLRDDLHDDGSASVG